MNFKYRGTLTASIKPIISEEKDKYLSLASAEKLKSIIPESVKGENNIDLLPFAASLCNVNRANRNGDLINTSVALESYKQFILRPINKRHKRDTTAGIIVAANLCKFDSEELITEEEAAKLPVYNIAVAGIIYKTVDPELAALVEECGDPNSDKYGEISLSWEIGFSEYDILVGSQYVSEGKVISNESGLFQDYDKLLSANGGSGKDRDGNQVYRLVKGKIFPLGAGIVENPAGYVEGIYSKTAEDDMEEKEDETEDESPEHENKEGPEHEKEEMMEEEGKCAACGEVSMFAKKDSRYTCAKCDTSYSGTYWSNFQDALKNSDKPSESQASVTINQEKDNLIVKEHKISVNKNQTIMKITKIEDITDEVLKESCASDVSQFITEQLKVACDKHQGEIQTRDEQISNAQTAIANQNKEIEALRVELEAIKNREASRAAVEKLTVRLAAIEEKYNISDEIREIVGSKIKTMNDDEYAQYLKEFEVFNKSNLKVKESTAAVVEDPAKAAAEAVASAAASQTTPTPPNSVTSEQSLVEKFKQAFSVNNIIRK